MDRKRYHHLQRSISNYLLDSNKTGGRAPKLVLKNWELLLGILEAQEHNVVDEDNLPAAAQGDEQEDDQERETYDEPD